MKKILWLDIEAADIKTDREGAVHEISYIIDVDGMIMKRGNVFCSPFKGDLVNAPSLDVCGKTHADILAYPHPTEGFKKLINDIHPYKKLVIGGFNLSYDIPVFLNWWWKCAKDLKKYDLKWVDYVFTDPLDVRALAIDKLLDKRESLDGFKLADVAGYIGIEVKDSSLHGAEYDIELTRDIYYRL